MVVLEYTLNPDAVEMDFSQILTRVINKINDFYKDPLLSQLWNEYCYLTSIGDTELDAA